MLFCEARVLNRQLESGELDHSSASSQVFVMKWCFRHCPRLGHRPTILPVSVTLKITTTARKVTKLLAVSC
jgi:hypothetical protein